LDSFKQPQRGFSGVVIGEPQRAFYGNQFGLTFPVFVHYGVELWVPEVGGAVDPGSEAHDLVMSLYGGMSKGERTRIKTRVRTAMAAQAAIEGRFLGGRPPYGYQLIDVGPHPNPAKAAIGQRLRQLAPDPLTAPVVERIFTEYREGRGLQAIAAGLTRDRIPSPSAHDPARNPHRAGSGGAWAKSVVRAILGNPRYTGHQVWNKQRKDEILIDVDDVALGHETRMRWNDRSAWVWSEQQVHEPLITIEAFEAAQAMFDRTKRATKRTPSEGRRYLLAGMMRCGICDRRMQGQWNHGKPYYRCKYPSDYPVDEERHPKSVYVRENAILPGLDNWLASLFDDEHIEHTCDVLAGSSESDPESEARQAALREQIRSCDRRLERYRALLDAGEAVPTVATWIAEVERERKTAQADLGRVMPGGKLTKSQARALVEALRDIADVLANADPEDRAQLYAELGVTLTYHTSGRVAVEALPRGLEVRVGGGT
jgi:hypothetical protein